MLAAKLLNLPFMQSGVVEWGHRLKVIQLVVVRVFVLVMDVPAVRDVAVGGAIDIPMKGCLLGVGSTTSRDVRAIPFGRLMERVGTPHEALLGG
jgi:hypothetical protein